MKKLIFPLGFFLMVALAVSVYSQLNPSYVTNFGYGSIVASRHGVPNAAKFNADQFSYKNKTFYFPPEEKPSCDLLAILPKDTTIATHMAKLMKEKSRNLAAKKAEYLVWEIWCSHSGGRNQATKWPASLNETPSWSAPCTDVFINYNPAKDGPRDTYLAPWNGELMGRFKSTLHDAKPGYKFYIVFRVAYKYHVPGGKSENKWNSVLRKWETVISTDGIGYEYSNPLASCSLEIEPYKQVEIKLTDNGDGTMTDTTHNIMWMKTPPTREKLWDDANQYVKELEFAGHKDWRLPTAAEMNDLFMAVKADPDGDCSWFKKMGFGYMICAAYWSSDAEVVDGKKTSKMQIFDFRYKNKGAQEKNYTMFFWPVRNLK